MARRPRELAAGGLVPGASKPLLMVIEYELEGQKVPREQFVDALEDFGMGPIAGHIVNELSTRIDALKCDEHGGSPTVTAMLSEQGPNFQVAGAVTT